MPHDACNTLHLPPVLTACCSKLEVLNLDVGEAEVRFRAQGIKLDGLAEREFALVEHAARGIETGDGAAQLGEGLDSQYCECQRIHVNMPSCPPATCLPARLPPHYPLFRRQHACLPACPHAHHTACALPSH